MSDSKSIFASKGIGLSIATIGVSVFICYKQYLSGGMAAIDEAQVSVILLAVGGAFDRFFSDNKKLYVRRPKNT